MAFAKIELPALPDDPEPKIAGVIVALSIVGLALLRKITR